MLGDYTRLKAYDRALAWAIRPGDTVIDVGAGTLALSLLALSHGAGRVYAVEADPAMAALAEQIAERNKLQGRITVVNGDARTVRLPRKADLVVSEMMGNLGPEEEMAEIVTIAARRGLRSGGRVVPERLVTHLRAIEFDRDGWGVWRDDFWGFSLSVVQEYASPMPQLHVFNRRPRVLSAPVVLSDERLGEPSATAAGDATIEISKQGKLQAVIGYFTATLAPDIKLSNFPGYPGCNWAVPVWPLRHTDVVPGDALRVRLAPPRAMRAVTQWRLSCEIARVCRRRDAVRGRFSA